MICVIDRKDTTVEYRAGCLYIRQSGKKNRPLPIDQLEQVVVYGNPLVQTSVWRNLAAASVPVVMLSSRGKPQTAMLSSGLAVRLPLRRMQHRLADIEAARVAMAVWFINKKICGYSLGLAALGNHFQLRPDHKKMLQQRWGKAKDQLCRTETVHEVMGVEGRLAQGWFSLLAKTLPAKLRFTERNRRPPRDPVNSLLSLGYTMLLAEVRQAMLMEGFDPSLGFLHQDYPGREALALDFMEIFRTGVDAFILNWLAETPLDATSFFYRKQDGCRLSKSTRPLFFQAWAGHREDWPRHDSAGKPEQRAHIREILLGQIAEARQYMIKLEQLYVGKKASA